MLPHAPWIVDEGSSIPIQSFSTNTRLITLPTTISHTTQQELKMPMRFVKNWASSRLPSERRVFQQLTSWLRFWGIRRCITSGTWDAGSLGINWEWVFLGIANWKFKCFCARTGSTTPKRNDFALKHLHLIEIHLSFIFLKVGLWRHNMDFGVFAAISYTILFEWTICVRV